MNVRNFSLNMKKDIVEIALSLYNDFKYNIILRVTGDAGMSKQNDYGNV